MFKMNITESPDQQNRSLGYDFSVPSTHWNQVTPQYMPWGHTPAHPAAALVTFTAQPAQQAPQQPSTSSVFEQRNAIHRPLSGMYSKPNFFSHCKRKAGNDLAVPSPKQHVTEERMAAHMSRLHISSETIPETPHATPEETARSREQRLYVCEEMRRLQTESILPSSLLGRIERPCMAVMLWQPPPKIRELLPPNMINLDAPRAIQQPENSNTEDADNNNSSTLDLNTMEMDT